jgi:hypothetical protein
MRTVCVVICFLLVSSSAHAQSDWAALTKLSPGARLRIESIRGGQTEGILQSVDEEELNLEKKPAAPRAEIHTIKLLGAPRTATFARWGFMVGAIAGGSVAYATAHASKGVWALYLGASWGAVGALIGAIDGAQSRQPTTIYTSP